MSCGDGKAFVQIKIRRNLSQQPVLQINRPLNFLSLCPHSCPSTTCPFDNRTHARDDMDTFSGGQRMSITEGTNAVSSECQAFEDMSTVFSLPHSRHTFG